MTNSRSMEQKELIKEKITALFDLLEQLYGAEDLILKAAKFNALAQYETDNVEQRLLALQKIIKQDPLHNDLPSSNVDRLKLLANLEEQLVEELAKYNFKQQLREKVRQKLSQKQAEYRENIKKDLLKDESKDSLETPKMLKKYIELEALEKRGLNLSATEFFRPKSLKEIIGQTKGIEALLTKLASPYPQHMIIYGPPGVGKTTAARLALQEAKQMAYTPFASEAKFVEVDATTLRWDSREATNPLLGSVHDPIYQGARGELAKNSIPEPKLGLVTEAHGGILFIDEIAELDPILQNKLLKVLEDKRVKFNSSYYDKDLDQAPEYIKKLFEVGAPADFILIGATTRQPDQITSALRSRTSSIFFNPLTANDIKKIVLATVEKIELDFTAQAVDVIAQYTLQGRRAVNIMVEAYSLALYQQKKVITEAEVLEVIKRNRLQKITKRKSNQPQIGRVLGLGVSNYLGTILEIEACVFKTKQATAQVRINEAAGKMVRDSIFNALTALKRLFALELENYDIHVNIVGGGRVDGPSAGIAILIAIYSALKEIPIRQDIAVTGEISLRGEIKPVGGIVEKIYGASRSGVKEILLPTENNLLIKQNEIKITSIKTIEEALTRIIFKKEVL